MKMGQQGCNGTQVREPLPTCPAPQKQVKPALILDTPCGRDDNKLTKNKFPPLTGEGEGAEIKTEFCYESKGRQHSYTSENVDYLLSQPLFQEAKSISLLKFLPCSTARATQSKFFFLVSFQLMADGAVYFLFQTKHSQFLHTSHGIAVIHLLGTL